LAACRKDLRDKRKEIARREAAEERAEQTPASGFAGGGNGARVTFDFHCTTSAAPKVIVVYSHNGHNPSGPRTTSMMPLVFELIVMLALLTAGFVFGRIWEMRQELIRRRSQVLDNAGFNIPTARLPTL
jgi:hypothetical protein